MRHEASVSGDADNSSQDDPFPMKPFSICIQRCASHRIQASRQMAARALDAVVTTAQLPHVLRTLVSSLISARNATNLFHGVLLQICALVSGNCI